MCLKNAIPAALIVSKAGRIDYENDLEKKPLVFAGGFLYFNSLKKIAN